jgi:hypothetical protein
LSGAACCVGTTAGGGFTKSRTGILRRSLNNYSPSHDLGQFTDHLNCRQGMKK